MKQIILKWHSYLLSCRSSTDQPLSSHRSWNLPRSSWKWTPRPGWRASPCGNLHRCSPPAEEPAAAATTSEGDDRTFISQDHCVVKEKPDTSWDREFLCWRGWNENIMISTFTLTWACFHSADRIYSQCSLRLDIGIFTVYTINQSSIKFYCIAHIHKLQFLS